MTKFVNSCFTNSSTFLLPPFSKLVSALVLSLLDYCYAILVGLPMVTLVRLQRVFNAAARTVLDMRPSDHVTLALQELHSFYTGFQSLPGSSTNSAYWLTVTQQWSVTHPGTLQTY